MLSCKKIKSVQLLLCIRNYIESDDKIECFKLQIETKYKLKFQISKDILDPNVIKFDQCACHHTKWVELANIRISPLNIWLETTNPKSPRKTCQRHMIERYENILKQTK